MKIQLQYLAFQIMYRPRHYWLVKEIFRKLCATGAAKSNYNVINENSVSDDFGLNMAPFLRRRLISKQKGIDKLALQSHRITTEYRYNINNRNIKHPDQIADSITVYTRYPLLVEKKEILLQNARLANIEISDWYSTPVHPLEIDSWQLVHYRAGSCPNAENTCNKIVTLPVNNKVSKSDVKRTIEF